MITLTFLLILSVILPAIATPGDRDYGHHRDHNPKCLCDESATEIINNWIAIRSTNPSTPAYSTLVDSTFTNDITLEDSTISFFFFNDVTPYSTGKQQLISNFNFSWTTATSTPLIPAPEIPIRHSCDSITFRWVVSATVSLAVPGNFAKVGDPLHYAGTDVLILAPGTRLVQHVYASVDWIRLVFQEGTKLCFQRGAPKPVCADPPPPGCPSPLCQ